MLGTLIHQTAEKHIDHLGQPLDVTAKIRYAHPGVAATITPGRDGGARVKLHAPQRAITPGQAAVFYDGEVVLGGGWIKEAKKLQTQS